MRALFITVTLSLALTGCLNKAEKWLGEATTAASEAIATMGDVVRPDTPPPEAVELVSGRDAVGHRDFDSAKKVLPRVFAGMEEDFYCGCAYRGKQMDLESCGYVPRKNPQRAARLEWEHVVPAWTIGHQRQCWKDGGRKHCSANDDVYRVAEGDLHNLVPSIGEVNGDRGHFAFGAWTREPEPMYGQCTTVVDFKNRRVQPREEVRGRVARISLYMHNRYGLAMSRQDLRLWCAWARTYPVDDWERRRDARIARLQGAGNPLVSDPSALERLCAG
ncbi:deoxyribonuclease-1 [Crenobacter luteus]|uniref:endonuclease n=1 Tax=Crenobacter luteus TaxID=1452487 RepID=UPI00104544FA|nr:endonuclease [Crenobacter luteus]TCP14577.1 deoxyribonuclease-1 [Crenobacter luteus]